MIVIISLEFGGTLLVVFGLREVFRDIFHPTASGSLSDFVGRLASLLMRPRGCVRRSSRFRLSPSFGAG